MISDLLRGSVCCAVLFLGVFFLNKAARAQEKSAGPEMRALMLKTTAQEAGVTPTDEFPKVYGVLMDMPIKGGTATVFAASTGDASVYTTSGFSIIGGYGHPAVSRSAKELVKTSQDYFADAKPDSEHAYPGSTAVFFYLLTFEGVRKIEVSLADVQKPENRYYALGMRAQEVLTQLRLASEKKTDGSTR